MEDNHSRGFRPSHFRELAACIHHMSKKGEPSEALLYGNCTHKTIAWFMDENSDPTEAPEQTPAVKYAMALVWEFMVQGWKIKAIEEPVDILDDFDPITRGTIDLVMERAGEFIIIDWKTGDKGDYELQLHAYACAVMDLYPGFKSIRALIAYVDLKETTEVDVSFKSFGLIIDLYNRWKEKEKYGYNIGHQCHWCAIRPTCPAWRNSADKALARVHSLDSDTPKDLQQAEIDKLKSNPALLETFLIMWERAKTLVEDDWGLKGALRSHMETGYHSEHFSLVSIKPKIEKSIDPEQFLERIARKIGFMHAAPAIKVDADKAIEAWTNWTSDPLPVQVEETEKPGYSYVRQKGKPHAGEARRKKAME